MIFHPMLLFFRSNGRVNDKDVERGSQGYYIAAVGLR